MKSTKSRMAAILGMAAIGESMIQQPMREALNESFLSAIDSKRNYPTLPLTKKQAKARAATKRQRKARRINR